MTATTSRKHGTASSFLGQVERSKREAGHLPPSAAKIENVWRLTSTIPYVLVAAMLERRENFVFTIILNVQLIQTKVGQNFNKNN